MVGEAASPSRSSRCGGGRDERPVGRDQADARLRCQSRLFLPPPGAARRRTRGAKCDAGGRGASDGQGAGCGGRSHLVRYDEGRGRGAKGPEGCGAGAERRARGEISIEYAHGGCPRQTIRRAGRFSFSQTEFGCRGSGGQSGRGPPGAAAVGQGGGTSRPYGPLRARVARAQRQHFGELPPRGGDESVTAGLSVPLPLWYRRQGEIETAMGAKYRAEAERARARNELEQAITQHTQELRTAQDQLHVFETGLLKQAEQTLAVARTSFRQGVASLLDVLDAQRVYRQTLLEYAQVRADLSIALVRLERSLGTSL
ncbi:MAG: TolC family protein [Nitrospiraceae bacterium]